MGVFERKRDKTKRFLEKNSPKTASKTPKKRQKILKKSFFAELSAKKGGRAGTGGTMGERNRNGRAGNGE